MKLKSLIFALSLAAAGSAGATDTNLGDITGLVVPPQGVSVATGSFLDRYFFQVSLPSVGSGTVADFQVNNQVGGFFWNITALNADLYVDTGAIGAYDAVADTALYANLGSGDFIQNSGPLAAGSYYIAISGVGAGQAGGFYTWHAAAMPVPEAETWTMMGLGIGLIALQLRRRSRSLARRVG